MENEIWKDIKGYEGLYQVSNFGRTKSLGNGKTHKTERILKTGGRRGYLFVILYNNGIRKQIMVHRLVWEAFNGKIPEGYEINHVDENVNNNRLDNLNLMTHKDNINWGVRNSLVKNKLTNRIDHSKKVYQYSIDGKLIKIWPSRMEIERQLGYSNVAICYCCNGKSKTAYGYVWKN